MIKWSFIPAFMMVFLLSSCDFPGHRDNAEDRPNPRELLETDQNFSRMSSERGMKKAFLYYIAREGVLIRPEDAPFVGADAIELLSQIDDEDYRVSWNPLSARISDDGTMGYTFGTYSVEIDGENIKGSYVNIWQKQNGEWRFVLNATNRGEPE